MPKMTLRHLLVFAQHKQHHQSKPLLICVSGLWFSLQRKIVRSSGPVYLSQLHCIWLDNPIVFQVSLPEHLQYFKTEVIIAALRLFSHPAPFPAGRSCVIISRGDVCSLEAENLTSSWEQLCLLPLPGCLSSAFCWSFGFLFIWKTWSIVFSCMYGN